ncbi:MAG: DUF1559 domain-containing protein [Planctomycetes bacterium]|nr:DUF1559 domain-containing protein [Planctomycetota bacterium]
MTSSRPARRGFTLIEALVVGGLAAVLLAVLLPAVAQSRLASQRASCQNNLKMIGLALHNYHEVYGTFAPGWVAADAKAATHGFYGWQVGLLPFVEQARLYGQIDFNRRFDKPNVFTKTTLAIYRCPDDTSGDLNAVRGGYATSNYSGNYGSVAIRGSVDTEKQSNGVFWWNSSARTRDITDGLSNTFFVGERSVRSAAGIWAGARTNQNENDVVSDCSHESRLNTVIASFSSLHEGGANFLMCDGAVRFVPDTIESSEELAPPRGIYQRLAERHDGQVVGDF